MAQNIENNYVDNRDIDKLLSKEQAQYFFKNPVFKKYQKLINSLEEGKKNSFEWEPDSGTLEFTRQTSWDVRPSLRYIEKIARDELRIISGADLDKAYDYTQTLDERQKFLIAKSKIYSAKNIKIMSLTKDDVIVIEPLKPSDDNYGRMLAYKVNIDKLNIENFFKAHTELVQSVDNLNTRITDDFKNSQFKVNFREIEIDVTDTILEMHNIKSSANKWQNKFTDFDPLERKGSWEFGKN